jgi:formamidopyrimidine-DNA glycosylase
MPELPEVEFARGCLSRWLSGRTLARVDASRSRVLRTDPRKLAELSGCRVRAIERRGKWLIWHLDRGLGLLAHLGMTGKFELATTTGATVRWSRVRFALSDGNVLHFRDPRMFGSIQVGSLIELERALPPLGPDALTVGPELLAALVRGRARPIKDLLMDQSKVAGLGNIYVTEALFRARIHPSRPAQSLLRPEIGRLARGIAGSLSRMLATNTGDTITYVEERLADNPFQVYGRAGEPCPRCKKELASIVIASRTSTFCPRCQPARGGSSARRPVTPPRARKRRSL